MGACKPLVGEPLTFWHVSGDIVWRGQPIEARQAVALRALYSDEARAAYRAKAFGASAKATSLYIELKRALDALDHWARVVGRPSPVEFA